jgi:hypothetical protein
MGKSSTCGAIVALVRDGVADAVMAQIYGFFESEAMLATGGDEVSGSDVAEAAASAEGGGFGGVPGKDGGEGDAEGTVESRWMEAQESGLDESHDVDDVKESKLYNQGYFDSYLRAFAIDAAQSMNEARSAAEMMGVSGDAIAPVRVNIPFSDDVLSDIITNVLRGIPYEMAAKIAPTYFASFAPYYSGVLEQAVSDAVNLNTVPFEDVVQAAGMGGLSGDGDEGDEDDDDEGEDEGADLEAGLHGGYHAGAEAMGGGEGGHEGDGFSDQSAESFGSIE